MPSTQSSSPKVGPSRVSAKEATTPIHAASRDAGFAPTTATATAVMVHTAGMTATAWTRTSRKVKSRSELATIVAMIVPAMSMETADSSRAMATLLA